jgi:hypothetical protein
MRQLKKEIFFFLCVLLTNVVIAQTTYTSFPDPENNSGLIYKGLITKYLFQNQPLFTWYKQNQESYHPKDSLLTAMSLAAPKKYAIVLFGGSWCDDTQFILSRFFKLQELSGYPDSCIDFFAVDREKKTIGNISAAFQVSRVPTIIVFKEGKEIGRVVEYGISGNWENDLLSLLLH